MGVHILSDKFFQVGDVVRYNGMEGVVISFNVRTTKLKLVNYNEILTISNRNITEIMVMTDMFDLDIGLPYFVDSEKIHETMEVLTERIRKISGITNAMYKGTERFNESSVTYRIRYWTPPDGRRFDIRRAALRIVQDGLKEAGIPFPYNHLDVELVGSAGSAGSETYKASKVSFENVPEGTWKLVVTNPSGLSTETESFEVKDISASEKLLN